MAKRNGGIIGPSNVPNPFIAKGVWKLRDAFNYIKAGLWPATLGYQVNNSLRFDVASTDFLIRTIASTGSNQIWTASGWIKRQQLGASSSLYCSSDSSAGNNFRSLFINASDQVQCAFIDGTYTFQVETNALLRDVSAWYHIVAAVDTTQATASNRVKIWINGVLQTSFATASYPTQNATINFSSSGYKQLIASLRDSSTILNGCYLAEMHILDGVAKQASDFGQTDSATGIWTPIAYSGTYGTNGFYLKFANSASLGTDSSGNGNNFTVNNLTSVDQSTDTPTNNFATFNSLSKNDAGTVTFSEGNLKTAHTGTDSRYTSYSTIGVSSGKWYTEFKIDVSAQPDVITGVGYDPVIENQNRSGGYLGEVTGTWGYFSADGNKYVQGTASAYGSTYGAGDIIGIALDLDNNYLYFSKNGTFQNSGVPTSGATGTGGISITANNTYFMACCHATTTTRTSTYSANFGSPPYAGGGYTDDGGFGNFSYQPPSGFYSLCTRTLAALG